VGASAVEDAAGGGEGVVLACGLPERLMPLLPPGQERSAAPSKDFFVPMPTVQ
jgi:hypothetical protein